MLRAGDHVVSSRALFGSCLYILEEVLGRNCRFLQGPGTDPLTVAAIRNAVRAGAPLIVDLLNYRRDGSTFWNRLSLRPVHNASGVLTHYIGIQSDISRMRELEGRLLEMALDLARLADG